MFHSCVLVQNGVLTLSLYTGDKSVFSDDKEVSIDVGEPGVHLPQLILSLVQHTKFYDGFIICSIHTLMVSEGGG